MSKRTFKSEDTFIKAFTEFLDYVVEKEYKILPSKYQFCKWYTENHKRLSRRTLYNTLNVYFPNIKKEYADLLSDVLSEGGALGHYHSIMTIFILKNWCGWADKTEQIYTPTETEDDPLTKSIKEALKEIKKEQ